MIHMLIQRTEEAMGMKRNLFPFAYIIKKTKKQGHVFHIDLNSLSSLLYFILHVQTQHQEVHSEFLGP